MFAADEADVEPAGTTNAWAVVPVATAATAATNADRIRVHIYLIVLVT